MGIEDLGTVTNGSDASVILDRCIFSHDDNL
jgi:hypothetical protein